MVCILPVNRCATLNVFSFFMYHRYIICSIYLYATVINKNYCNLIVLIMSIVLLQLLFSTYFKSAVVTSFASHLNMKVANSQRAVTQSLGDIKPAPKQRQLFHNIVNTVSILFMFVIL